MQTWRCHILVFLFILISFRGIGQNYIPIPDTTLYEKIKPEFRHNDPDHSIDTLSCRPGWWQMNFSNILNVNLFGIQFLKCKTGYLYCSGDCLTSLDYYPPRVEQLDCSRNDIKIINHLPKGLIGLTADNNLLEYVSNLPEGLKYCSLKRNKLTVLPKLPKSLQWLNYIGNPIDTSLLGSEFKDNPCLYPNQNCLPKKKYFQNLYGLKLDSSFDINDIRKIEIKISGTHSWGYKPTGSTYIFKTRNNEFICDSVMVINMNKTPSVVAREVNIKSAFLKTKKILEHIVNGDKIIPLLDIKSSDTSNQIINFYDPFDGERDCDVGCADCSYYEFKFTFLTSKSEISIVVRGSNVYVEGLMGICDNSKVFPTQTVAEWMYAYALSHQLLPAEKITDVFFSDKDFNQFKKRMSLR
jgi:hypothetical protein